MSGLNKYYKVTDGCSYCILETLEEAQQMILDEMEIQYEIGDCINPSYLSIEETFMTEDEFNSLLEFEGF